MNAPPFNYKGMLESLGSKNVSGMGVPKVSPRSANLTVKGSKDETPLIIAAKSGQASVVRTLLNKGANITAKNEKEEDALIKAVKNRHIETVRVLLDYIQDQGLDIDEFKKINSLFGEEKTLLAYMVKESIDPNNDNYIDFIRLFLQNGANPEKAFINVIGTDMKVIDYIDKCIKEGEDAESRGECSIFISRLPLLRRLKTLLESRGKIGGRRRKARKTRKSHRKHRKGTRRH